MNQDEDQDSIEVVSTPLERAITWLHRQQWVAVVLFILGVILVFVLGRVGWYVVGGSLALAGLFPILAGVYRSAFGTLYGWKARMRGLFSVLLGLIVIGLASFF